MKSRNPRPKAVITIVAQYLGLSIMLQWWDQFQAAEGWASVGWAASATVVNAG